MSDLPGDLLYTKNHEWLRREDDGSVSIGITDHAQSALGDLVYVELPEVGQDVVEGGDMAVVESVMAGSFACSRLMESMKAHLCRRMTISSSSMSWTTNALHTPHRERHTRNARSNRR